jgi:hypothetical protein
VGQARIETRNCQTGRGGRRAWGFISVDEAVLELAIAELGEVGGEPGVLIYMINVSFDGSANKK